MFVEKFFCKFRLNFVFLYNTERKIWQYTKDFVFLFKNICDKISILESLGNRWTVIWEPWSAKTEWAADTVSVLESVAAPLSLFILQRDSSFFLPLAQEYLWLNPNPWKPWQLVNCDMRSLVSQNRVSCWYGFTFGIRRSSFEPIYFAKRIFFLFTTYLPKT